jgi:hypothetical protein
MNALSTSGQHSSSHPSLPGPCRVRLTQLSRSAGRLAKGKRSTNRRRPESNRRGRLCRPLRSHSATSPACPSVSRSAADRLAVRTAAACDCGGCHGRPLGLAAPGRLAQLGERRLDKAEVTGSSPVSPTTDTPEQSGIFASMERPQGTCRALRRMHPERAAPRSRPDRFPQPQLVAADVGPIALRASRTKLAS